MNTKALVQGSPEWHKCRKERLTASVFASAMGISPYQSRQKLWGEMVGELPKFEGNEACDWGIEHEADAVFEYEAYMGVFTQETGFWEMGEFGCSPDRLISDGLIECKCPFSLNIHQEVPAHYMAQIQGQLQITEKEWCDFVSWTPDDLTIFHVLRNQEYWDKAVTLLNDFWECVQEHEKPKRRKKPVLPEVVVEKIK